MAKTDWGLTDTVRPDDFNDIGREINQLHERLNTVDTDDVVLQPGIQVIHASKDARFKLGRIEGKTEINYEGRIGLIGVESPYVINTSGNLLPPFYEAEAITTTGLSIIDPYKLAFALTGTSVNVIRFWISVAEGETYTFNPSMVNGDNFQVVGFSDDKTTVTMPSLGVVRDKITFTVPAESGTKYLRLTLISGDSTGSLTVTNPLLTFGPEPQPFVPQRKSMLAFQTELHANPTDGSEPDVLFERDGGYRKLAKWEKVVLDGALNWEPTSPNFVGFKKVRITDSAWQTTGSKFMTKYNGATLVNVASNAENNAGDIFQLHSSGSLNVSVNNTDSGWRDDYTPTPDEIKVYFWGWTMCNVDGSVPYSGSGERRWKAVGKPGAADTNILPTAPAPNRTPYQLLYRLAKETVEPVTSEGALTLAEGDNMVEVGTGIVLRERANPQTLSNGITTAISSTSAPASYPKFKVGKAISVYRDSRKDDKWVIGTPGYGNERWEIYNYNYDPSAAYSVTYIKLDKSPIQPIIGTLAENEKAQITDLTAGVAEALQRVSVVEQKKADEDAPGWITPTLLNGWVAYGGSFEMPGYFKDSLGVVRLKGLIKSGVITSANNIFHLPTGYRPKALKVFTGHSNDGTVNVLARIDVSSSGAVRFNTGGSGWLSLEEIQFLAEQ